ncbi:tpr repeat-containingprotein [Gossypium arboreum]|uniref:Tpr repeat-containingprotein n=1 Tax=Gossypium arboreum TaxID=29729 RepID=A0A0B0PAK2_GOSAR|nr:tpr repeat-containingprotein [Gossypium arboreum]
MQPTCPGIGGSVSSGGDARAAQQTTSFTPLIVEPTQSFSLALAENIPQNRSSATQSSHSKHLGNSGPANSLNSQTGKSLRAELQRPQRVEPLDKGKKILFADEVEKKKGNPRSNRNQRAVHYPNLFPQSPTGIRFLNGESTQTNQPPAPTRFCNKETDLYRSLAPGSLVDQFKATNVSNPLCYNLMLPEASTPPRPQQLSNPMQLLNQLAAMPNASGSVLQNSDLTKHSLPMELMAQQFSYQNNQLPWALGLYNSQTGSTVFHEIFIPLSLSIWLSVPFYYQHKIRKQILNFVYRPVAVHQRGFLNQTTKPTATYPSSGTSMSSLLLNSSLLHETVGSSAPNLMQTPLSNHSEQGTSEPGGNARSRLEVGESSPFKRLRIENKKFGSSNNCKLL